MSGGPRTGGRLVVDQLAAHGVDVAFGVPGESYIAVLDALLDSPIRFVTCRHEVGAATMAEAYGKLTGRPGVCMVTRGPGATHASCGVHTAYQDATPLLLLVGQVERRALEREAFQEIDYRRMFGPLAKWVAQVEHADRIPELVARAFAVATSGRPGPVVLALPEDVLVEQADVDDAAPYRPAQATPGAADLARARALLQDAERPLVVVGGQPWSESAHDALGAWCAASDLPVASAWRCQDYVDNTLHVYVGHLGLGLDPRLARRLAEADVLLVIGARLGDIETAGYERVPVPTPAAVLVHAHPGAEELGRVYQPTLPILAAGPELVAGLASPGPLDGGRWRGWAQEARADYLDNLAHQPSQTGVDLAAVMAHLRERLPPDAILTNGAGNFTVWAHRFYEFRRYRTQLAPISGAMGYGIPAAIAAKLVHPERIVVCVAGDGDFLMTAQELATAVQYELPIVVLVADNGMYGTIRMHQELQFPGRVSGTDLRNPDFAALARAFGGHGERVERTEDIAGAFERALESRLPAVIHAVTDPDAITPRTTLTAIRARA